MFFYPWYPAMLLAIEANNVIDIRMRRIASGRLDAAVETRLMVDEKLDAMVAAVVILMRSGDPFHVIDNYRRMVADNATRLADLT